MGLFFALTTSKPGPVALYLAAPPLATDNAPRLVELGPKADPVTIVRQLPILVLLICQAMASSDLMILSM